MRLAGIPDEVEQVRDLNELRSGLVLWEINCEDCAGGTHRYMLVSPCRTRENEPCWTLAPIPACADPSDLELVGPHTVESGDLYRVVDPKMEAVSPAGARTRKLVRA